MNASNDSQSRPERIADPGRFTTVAIETKAGEIEARLSEYGNWSLRVRRHGEETWRQACAGDLTCGVDTAEPVLPRDEGPLVCGPLRVDLISRVVRVDAVEVRLTRKEFDLLAVLARQPERLWSKQQLMKGLWGYEGWTRTRTLDSHASRVRRKLAEAGAPGMVVNTPGVGYKLLNPLGPEAYAPQAPPVPTS